MPWLNPFAPVQSRHQYFAFRSHLRRSAAREIEFYRIGVAMTAILRARVWRRGDNLIDRLFQTTRISVVILRGVNVTV
jgi:hypothetical protein